MFTSETKEHTELQAKHRYLRKEMLFLVCCSSQIKQTGLVMCWLSTCSRMELILSTSQSMRKRFSCRRSISSMMRLYSVGSTMFPTERAVTCQLLATADSMMAWRIAKPGGAEGEELHHTTVSLLFLEHNSR